MIRSKLSLCSTECSNKETSSYEIEKHKEFSWSRNHFEPNTCSNSDPRPNTIAAITDRGRTACVIVCPLPTRLRSFLTRNACKHAGRKCWTDCFCIFHFECNGIFVCYNTLLESPLSPTLRCRHYSTIFILWAGFRVVVTCFRWWTSHFIETQDVSNVYKQFKEEN